MTDNDKEVVQTLKNHLEAEDCVTCESFGKCNEFLLTKNTLDLINRQQAEIERLKNKILEDDRLLNNRVQESINAVSSANQKYVDALEKAFNDRTAELQITGEEIEKLNNCTDGHCWNFCLTDCEGASNDCWKTCHGSRYNKIKNEAVKQFANKLKENITNAIDIYYNSNGGGYYLAEDTIEDIDSLVKEMLGDTE